MVNKAKKEIKRINISFIICLNIFMPILLILLIIIAKATVYRNQIPDVFGYKPFIALNDTKTEIKKDDLILTKIIDVNQIQTGDIILYRENDVAVVHQIVNIIKENNNMYLIANVTENEETNNIKLDNKYIESKYLFRIAKLRWNFTNSTQLFFVSCDYTWNGVNDTYNLLQKEK